MMDTRAAVRWVFESDQPPPSPATLALLGAHARSQPVGIDLHFNSAWPTIENGQAEFGKGIALLEPAVDANSFSATWRSAATGVLSGPASKWFADILDQARRTADAAEGARKFDADTRASLAKMRDSLQSDVKRLDAMLGSRDGSPSATASSPTLGDLPGYLDKVSGFLDQFGPKLIDKNALASLKNAINIGKGMLGVMIKVAAATTVFGAAEALFGVFSLFGSGGGAQEAQFSALAEILKALEQLAQQLQQQYLETIWRLDAIEGDVLYNRRLILASGVTVQLNQCVFFLETRDGFGYTPTGFPSAERAEAHCRALCTSYAQGRNALEAIFSGSPRFHEVFLRRSLEGQTAIGESAGFTGRGVLRESVYEPLVQFLYGQCRERGIGDPKIILESLLKTSETAELADAKMLSAMAGEIDGKPATEVYRQWEAEVARNVPLGLSFEDLLEPAVIDQVVRLLLSFVPYWEWVKAPSTGEFFGENDWDTVLKEGYNRVTPRALLLKALHLVDAGIAQQNLIAGDALLPWLYEKWKPLTNGTEDSAVTVYASGVRYRGTVLAANPVLASNFILFIMKQSRRVTPAQYSFADSVADLNRLFPEIAKDPRNLQFTKLAKAGAPGPGTSTVQPGWAIRIERLIPDGNAAPDKQDRYIYTELPSFDDFVHGRLRPTGAAGILTLLRQDVMDKLAGYNYNLTGDKNQCLSFLMLGGKLG